MHTHFQINVRLLDCPVVFLCGLLGFLKTRISLCFCWVGFPRIIYIFVNLTEIYCV